LKGCGVILALGGIAIGLGKLSPSVVVATFQAMVFILICSIALKRGWFNFFDMFGDEASASGWFWALVGFGIAFKIAFTIGWIIKRAKEWLWVGSTFIGGLVGLISMLYVLTIANSAASYFSFQEDREELTTPLVSSLILLLGVGMGALFGYNFYQISGNLLSSYQGSYLLVRGISLWFGGFINERDIIIALRSPEADFPHVTAT